MGSEKYPIRTESLTERCLQANASQSTQHAIGFSPGGTGNLQPPEVSAVSGSQLPHGVIEGLVPFSRSGNDPPVLHSQTVARGEEFTGGTARIQHPAFGINQDECVWVPVQVAGKGGKLPSQGTQLAVQQGGTLRCGIRSRSTAFSGSPNGPPQRRDGR